MQVIFKKEFTYWHGGHTAETFPPGETDVSEEVAASAKACGVLDVGQTVATVSDQKREEENAAPESSNQPPHPGSKRGR